MGLQDAFARAQARVEMCKVADGNPANVFANRAGGSNAALGMFGDQDANQAQEQYKHFRDWCYAAIRYIAQRIAGQPINVGRAKGKAGAKRTLDRIHHKGRLNPWKPSYKSSSDDVDVLDKHPLLDAIDDPNEMMTSWALLYNTVASLEITGRAYWWLVEIKGQKQIWPLPSSWVTPLHDEGKFYARWAVKAPESVGKPEIVPGEKIAYFYYPDPSDPFGAISPLQAIARAVSADESIQVSQAMQFKNALRPSYGLIIGDVIDQNGKNMGPPLLEKEQKEQIIYPLLQYYRGAIRNGEPILFDAMVKDLKKIDPAIAEMDYQNSGAITKKRVLGGFGVNEVLLGELESANRAAAVAADDHFCSAIANPKLELLSQVMTSWVGPAFAGKSENLVVWIEPCRPNDVEGMKARYDAARSGNAVSVNEYRRDILNLAPVKGGNVVFGTMTQVPIPLTPEDEEGQGIDEYFEQQKEEAAAAQEAAAEQQAAALEAQQQPGDDEGVADDEDADDQDDLVKVFLDSQHKRHETKPKGW